MSSTSRSRDESQAVYQAMRDFDSRYVHPNDFESWLERPGEAFAVVNNGRPYPPRYLVRNALVGNSYVIESTEEAKKFFRNLGFETSSLKSLPTWVRDELILALDLYFRHRPKMLDKGHIEVIELSELLRELPLHQGAHYFPRFRNPSSVAMKLANFRRLDPDFPQAGLSAGSKGDREVWDEFFTARPRLRKIARAIRTNYRLLSDNEQAVSEPEAVGAPEGRILYRLHRIRERKPDLVKKKKSAVLRQTGKLACEVCAFDFSLVYGELGYGFAECHHTKPIEALLPGAITYLSDLAIVCSNCHRMIHAHKPALTIHDLRQLVRAGPYA